jgi:hypothetical protein
MPSSVLGSDVDVYAQGAYNGAKLDLYVYADINLTPPDAILSFGVKVEYPGELSNPVATKNEDVWYFGDGGPEFAYMNPEVGSGGVVIIGGKLDTSAPTAGVTGSRVLLGTITFDYAGVTDPIGVTITYGRGDGTGDYKNFVGTDGFVYDGAGVSFAAVVIHERGDANGDGAVDAVDYVAIRNNINATSFPPWMDCNEDDAVDAVDYVCVRNKI